MVEIESALLNFHPVSLEDRDRYQQILWNNGTRGCEYSFPNLFMWGEQNITFTDGHAVLFSRFGSRYLYPYPIGSGEKKTVLDAIMRDAAARGIEWRFSGLLPHEKDELASLYPNRFEFVSNEGSLDYVYSIDDLADLAGRKYHSKRNHCKRFEGSYPNHVIEKLDDRNLPRVREMVTAWYDAKQAQDPDGDFDMEKIAIERAFDNYSALGFEGLALISSGEVLAFTMGNRMTEDTFDVNYEKARPNAEGAYAAINRAFARYIREKYPEVRFLNREEDMGIEGLRRAKMSYYPHHRVEKYRAVPKGE